MKLISREWAMQTISMHKSVQMSKEEKTDYLFDAGILANDEVFSSFLKEDLLSELIDDLFGVTNQWLLQKLTEIKIVAKIEINDFEVRYECVCCNHLSLRTKSDFEICEICFWEDGFLSTELNIKSSTNQNLTLGEAKKNFMEFGAIQERFLDNVKPSIKYPISIKN